MPGAAGLWRPAGGRRARAQTRSHAGSLTCGQVQEKRSFTLKLSSPTFERDRAADTEQASVSPLAWRCRLGLDARMPRLWPRLRLHLAAAQRLGPPHGAASRSTAPPHHHARAWRGHPRGGDCLGLSGSATQRLRPEQGRGPWRSELSISMAIRGHHHRVHADRCSQAGRRHAADAHTLRPAGDSFADAPPHWHFGQAQTSPATPWPWLDVLIGPGPW